MKLDYPVRPGNDAPFVIPLRMTMRQGNPGNKYWIVQSSWAMTEKGLPD
jgi:hypothetical protein